MAIVQGVLPLALEEAIKSGDPELAALARAIAALPPADQLCPSCIALAALPWPDYGHPRLCAAHLPLFRALQCKGWNADRWHQHLAGLARWGRLPRPVEWWPSVPAAAGDEDGIEPERGR